MNYRNLLSLGGSVVTAVAASACCILPLILGTASAGTVGLGAAMAPYRPYLMTLTFLLLGSGFYVAYRPANVPCCEGTESCRSKQPRVAQRANKAILWLVTLFSIGSMAYPWFAASQAETVFGATSVAANDRSTKTVAFHLGNMTCEECAVPILKALKKLQGVQSAKVDFAAKQATVRYDSSKISVHQLRTTIEKTGFPAFLPGDQRSNTKVVAKTNPRSLTTMSDEVPLKEAFNAESDKTRLILLLSPT